MKAQPLRLEASICLPKINNPGEWRLSAAEARRRRLCLLMSELCLFGFADRALTTPV